jgi:hypothetical protein
MKRAFAFVHTFQPGTRQYKIASASGVIALALMK